MNDTRPQSAARPAGAAPALEESVVALCRGARAAASHAGADIDRSQEHGAARRRRGAARPRQGPARRQRRRRRRRRGRDGRVHRPADAHGGAHRGHGGRPGAGRRSARSGRRGDHELDASERPRDRAGAGAARRRRLHLRVAPQRHRRRRRALPQVGQRGRPARRQRGLPHQRRDRRRLERRAPASLPAGAIALVRTGDREAVRVLLRQDDSIDVIVPRGGEELMRAITEGSASRSSSTSGHLPPLRRPRRRPGDGRAHLPQRQGAAPRRLQRHREPPRAPRRRGALPPRMAARFAAAGVELRGVPRDAASRARRHSRRPTPTGTPSIST